MDSTGETVRHRGKKEESDDWHENDRKGHTGKMNKVPSTDIANNGRNKAKSIVSNEYLDKEPPIQFALFLIFLAALFTVLTVCINYARTSGWFDKFGKT